MDDEQGYPMPPPMMGFGHSSEGSLQYQINPTEILEEIENTLRGAKAEVHQGQLVWRIPEGHRPIINERGLNSILMILRSRLTKIFILSDLEKEAIEQITISVGQNVIDDLYYNWDNYGIKDDAAASQILSLVTDTVFSTLRKAHQGNYLKFLRTTQSIQEVQHRSVHARAPASEGRSLNPMSMLFGRNKR